MKEEIDLVLAELSQLKCKTQKEIEEARVRFLGKKGEITKLFEEFRNIDKESKKEFGKTLNELKQKALSTLEELMAGVGEASESSSAGEDLTMPGEFRSLGSRHPVSIVRRQIVDIFHKFGYDVAEGPEIEDDYHVFEALNFPPNHPARDMQDTFFIQTNPDILLRTHTSSVQIRYMENYQPPIRTISPGRVFRNEAISARSHCLFHQVEGLYIDKNVSFADLKQTLLYFTKEMFGKSRIRLRPSYFPFTEPSAEVDIYWGLNNEVDYRITKGTGWLEIMGCGMTDPNVLKNCGIDSEQYSGFAFGMGVERIAMLLYQIGDIRMFYENDARFLEQFKSAL